MRFAGANIAGYMSERPNFGELGDFNMKARSSERQTNAAAEGFIAQSGLDSMAKIKESKYRAEAIKAQGAANAAATRAQGMSSMMSGIAGGIGNMSFGGGGSFEYNKTPFGAGGGVVDGIGTLGPNYGIPQ